MFTSLSGPRWFFGLDWVFEFCVMLIALFIVIYSFRIYYLAKERKYIYFTLAFLAISAAFLIGGALDWIIYKNYLPNVPNLTAAVSTVVKTQALHHAALVMYSFLILSGFLILAAIFLRIHNPKILVAMLAVLMAVTLMSKNIFLTTNIILFIILSTIAFYQFKNYCTKGTCTAMLVLVAVILLALSQMFFIFAQQSKLFFVLGHGLQISGYVFLLINMILVLGR
ncbi:MAG: hypothetical protein QXK37_01205 [Candidatus Woesearchaeota archaeon]